MTSVEEEIKKFTFSEDNSCSFDFKEFKNQTAKFSIDQDYFFDLIVLEEGKYKFVSETEFLSVLMKEINLYCNEGKKTINDVLNKTTDLYIDLLSKTPIDDQTNLFQ
eukprot:gene8108-12569_t